MSVKLKQRLRRWGTLWAALVLALLLPVTALAAPGEDTFLTILVDRAPEGMVFELQFPDNPELEPITMVREDRAWETYFRVYFVKGLIKWRRGLPKGAELVVKNGEESFTMTFPEGLHTSENTVLCLDLETRKLEEGVPPFRSALLVALRVGATLLLQVLAFFLLGYRERRSWLIFLSAVAASQAVLAGLVMVGASTLTSDYVLWALVGLCLAEVFLTVVQTVLFSMKLWEHRERRAVVSAVLSNVITLAVGAVDVLFLPM